MFPIFGIFQPQSSDNAITVAGIETPSNTIQQKRFFGGGSRDDRSLFNTSRVERDVAIMHGADLKALPANDASPEQPQRFVTFFMPPYV